MEMTSHKKTLLGLGAIAMVLVLWGLYALYHRSTPISSDSTTMLPVASDLIHGNPLLKGWVLGSNNFIFTETIFYSMGYALGLSNMAMMQLIPALFYALLIVSMLLVFVLKDDHIMAMDFKRKGMICLCFLAIVGFVPPSATYTLLNANSHNNLYFWIVLCLWFIIRYYDTSKISFLIGFVVLLTLCQFSESVTLMVLFAPLGLYCLYGLWEKRTLDRQHMLVIGAMLVSFLLAKGMTVILESSGGLVTRGMPISLVSPAFMMRKVLAFLPELSILFGDAGGWTGSTFVYHLLMLLIKIGYIGTIIGCSFRFKRLSRVDRLLYLITVVNLMLCIITSTLVHHRYLVPAYVFGTMLFLRLAFAHSILRFERARKWSKVLLFSTVVVSCVIVGQRFYTTTQLAYPGETQVALVKMIQERGYGDGYGDFWCSSQVSYYSDFQIKLYPIVARDGILLPYPELVRKDWYLEWDKHFVISYADQRSGFINTQTLIKVLGEPDDSFVFAEYQVLYWQKDISLFVSPYDEQEANRLIERED